MTGRDGNTVHALDPDLLRQALQDEGPVFTGPS
jgi:hypothetical protein